MTLTQLAQKHNLAPESAKAFLREWLDSQEPIAWMFQYVDTGVHQRRVSVDKKYIERNAAVHGAESVPLIARPTDLGE